MASSLTLNAVTWIPGQLATILDDLELSVSLDEKITAMEEFISMLSLCSNGGLSHEMSVYSMWRDGTQMLSVATAHHRRVGRMRRRMATWLQEGSNAQSTELQYLRLARSGLELSWQSLEKSFLLLSRSWILGHFAAHSDLYELMPTGSTDQLSIPTSLPLGFISTRQKFHSLTTGYNEIWRDLLLVSDSITLRSPPGRRALSEGIHLC